MYAIDDSQRMFSTHLPSIRQSIYWSSYDAGCMLGYRFNTVLRSKLPLSGFQKMNSSRGCWRCCLLCQSGMGCTFRSALHHLCFRTALVVLFVNTGTPGPSTHFFLTDGGSLHVSSSNVIIVAGHWGLESNTASKVAGQ